MRKRIWLSVLAIGVIASIQSALAGPITITLDTTPLGSHPAGPFFLSFQLNDGSGAGNGNNTASLTSFNFGAGNAFGLPTLFGGATGDLTSGVLLTDTSFSNFFSQQFLPGSILSFTLNLSTNVELGPQPDQFSFAILDSSGFEIPYTGPFNAALVIDIDSANPVPQVFATDSTVSPFGGGDPIDMAAPGITSTVPEPSTLGLLSISLITLFSYKRRSRREARGRL